MTSIASPGGLTNTFTYNGLGLRVGKTDSTGTYSYLCDGATPGSPVLSDGHAVYTPGESESRGGASSYSAYDRLGNLWFVDNAATSQTFYEDIFGFGNLIGGAGTELSPFKLGGASGCQTDTDINFVLMGHRYYDSRQGRFISQDPAGDGDNWYAYCDNNPVNETDSIGLTDSPAGTPPGDYTYPDGRPYTVDDRGFVCTTGTVVLPASGGSSDASTSSGGFVSGGSTLMFPSAGPGNVPDLYKIAQVISWVAPEFTPEKPDPNRVNALLGKGGTYILQDPATGDVMRTGRTKNLAMREVQHAKKFPSLKFIIDKVTDNYAEQRGREQMIQDLYKAPLDKIRGISWTNPKLFEYLEAAAKWIR